MCVSLFYVAGFQPSNDTHHKLINSLLMTSSDLSSTCKEFKWSRKIASLTYEEFFSQGDREKLLGRTPTAMMDRTKAFIPEQQLGFIDGIAGPVYRYNIIMCSGLMGHVMYSGTPLIRTPEMWPPLYSGHFEKSQSMLFNTNSPLKCGHPSNKDTFTGPKGGQFRGIPL